jgi:Nuclease-related domain
MIFKAKDSISDQLQELEAALQQPLPAQHRKRVEKELAQRRAGLKGENETAYHINFHLEKHPNWAVIHDLRIEWNGRVAQIDHLLMSRLMEIYVVESKSFRTKVRYANGGWERLNFNHWEGIPCPVEQNERHIAVLKDLINDLGLAPSRLGLTISPAFNNIVVVQPSCSIIGNYKGDARIYRLDSLVRKIRTEEPAALDVFKIISTETLYGFAAKLVAFHKMAPKPQTTLPPQPTRQTVTPSPAAANLKCQSCGGLLSSAEANYCRKNADRFAAQLLCRKCQDYAPKRSSASVATLQETPEPRKTPSGPRCVQCGDAVEQKVVYFCRLKSKQFGGRTLCRTCQALA